MKLRPLKANYRYLRPILWENKGLYSLLLLLIAIFGGSVVQSCSLLNEDLGPCASKPNTITVVNFVYDYNLQNEDLFDRHAGSVNLYVFNSDSIMLMSRSLSRTDMRGESVDFSMTFDTLDLVPGNRYLMVAMAQGNRAGYEASLATPGFQVPLGQEMIPGVSKLSDFRIVLDRDSDSYADIGIVNYKDAYGNNKEMMDTLWSTKPNSIQTVDIPYIDYKPQVDTIPDYYQEVTIPMMRITNAITVNLVHESFNTDTDPEWFNILIDFPNGNGTIDFTGTTYPARHLYYRSLRKEMAEYQQKQAGAQYSQSVSRASGDEYAIKATFGVSRLQNTDGSSLVVYDAKTGEEIVRINDFAKWLADYFDHHYDDNQEFLDRAYDFTIDIHLDNDGNFDWFQIGCGILGWGKRIQLLDF